jgi:hypothetical protein
MFSVPDHYIFQATSECNMKIQFCTNQITREEEGIHCLSLSQSINQFLVTLQKKKKKKNLLLQNKLFSSENFIIIRSKEPHLGDYPCM